MNSTLLRGLFVFWLANSLLRAAGTSDFDAANSFFKAGDYASAATAYEELLSTDGPRAAVFYNLGNTYQRLGQFGHAILAYERARLFTPRDPDLLANLTLVRKAAGAIEEPLLDPRLDAALTDLSRNEWSWLVVSSALVLGGLALISGSIELPNRSRLFALAAACLAGLTIIVGSTALYLRRDDNHRGIVLSPDATIRLSPFEKAEVLGTPGVGRGVQLGSRNGDFFYVEVTATHLHGWLAIKDVAALDLQDRSHANLRDSQSSTVNKPYF